MRNGELLVDKNGLMYYEDIIADVAKKENCGSYNIKDLYKEIDPSTGRYSGLVKYLVCEEVDLHNNIKEIIKQCNITEYKLDGNNAILFSNIRISYFEITKKYTLTLFNNDNAKENKYVRLSAVIKNINKIINNK